MPLTDRRAFLTELTVVTSMLATWRCAQKPSPPLAIDEATIDALQDAMNRGALTAVALCEHYRDLIAQQNPVLHAVIEVNPDLLEIAGALDRERRQTGPRGPLHGIPILVKDNIETADRMQTTAGSRLLEGVPVSADAFVVARLRAAGAVILGKANMTEWAGGGGRNGHSSRGGQSVNPYDHARTPMGSSSGSGIAVSANLTLAALGTETMGSIVVPSALLGVVGVRPTTGLTSRSGVIPVAASMDTVGPMARTVRDAAYVLDVLAVPDRDDAADRPAVWPSGFVAGLDGNIRGLRIGVVREPEAPEATRRLFTDAVSALAGLGAVVVPDVMLPELDDHLMGDQITVMLGQLKANLASYFARRRPGSPVRTLREIIAANTKAGLSAPPLDMAMTMPDVTDKAYDEAFARLRRATRDDGIDKACREHRLDLLVSPSLGPAPTFAEEASPANAWMPRAVVLASGGGTPIVSVPMGFVGGLPVGLCFLGSAWSDGTLLRCADAYERRTHHRRPPGLVK